MAALVTASRGFPDLRQIFSAEVGLARLPMPSTSYFTEVL
jgi:hypothetical protein